MDTVKVALYRFVSSFPNPSSFTSNQFEDEPTRVVLQKFSEFYNELFVHIVQISFVRDPAENCTQKGS